MKKNTNVLLIVALTILLTSCFSSMKVKVDIFDYQALRNSEDYKYYTAQSFAEGLDKLLSADLESEFTKIVLIDYDRFLKTNPNYTAQDLKDIKVQILDSLRTATAAFKTSILFSKQLLILKPVENLDTAYSLYYNANHKIKKLFRDVAGELEITGSGIETFVFNLSSRIDNYYTYGESITDDPLASLVIRSPEKYWKKYEDNIDITNIGDNPGRNDKYARSNKTLARTLLGNSDIAIKMDAPGNFIVKGARVDADEALKTSFKVLNQGIKYLAYANGVPVPNGNSGSNQTSEIKIPELAENDNLIHEKNTVSKQSDVFTKAFMKTLIVEIEKMKNNGDVTSVSNIKKSFEAYSKILKTEKK